jgi:hypothetical protein
MAPRLDFSADLPRGGFARSLAVRSGDLPLRLRLRICMTFSCWMRRVCAVPDDRGRRPVPAVLRA